MKTELRKKYLAIRDAIPEETRMEKSNGIAKKLLATQEYKNAKVIMFYVSVRSEVDTHNLLKESLKTKRVCVPVVKEKQIIAAEIKSFEDLNSENEFGVLEPANVIEIPKAEIDVSIIPGLTFDNNNVRIGYGLGYYDRFLNDTQIKKFGLAFKEQVVEHIPKDEWDVALDCVIVD